MNSYLGMTMVKDKMIISAVNKTYFSHYQPKSKHICANASVVSSSYHQG